MHKDASEGELYNLASLKMGDILSHMPSVFAKKKAKCICNLFTPKSNRGGGGGHVTPKMFRVGKSEHRSLTCTNDFLLWNKSSV